MSLLEGFDDIRLVKTGPSLRERLGQQAAAIHHRAIVARLRCFREELEHEMEPEPWMLLECSAVLLLSDICDAFGLLEEEKGIVFGPEGIAALKCELAVQSGELSDRQIAALECAHKHGQITLSSYRAVCPGWSDEALRLDLADLVKRGLLVRNGTCKGTYYTVQRTR